eukprot:6455486-Amphidinium_carterae.1
MAAGRKLRAAWDSWLSEDTCAASELESVAARLGTEHAAGFCRGTVEKARRILVELAGVSSEGEFFFTDGGYCVEAMEAWAQLSCEPDAEVVRWLREGTSVGIKHAIRPCNIFPVAGGPSRAVAESKWHAEVMAHKDLDVERVTNYA